MPNLTKEKNEIEERLIYNNYKLVTDKIRKILLNISNVPEILKKGEYGSFFKMIKMFQINLIELRQK